MNWRRAAIVFVGVIPVALIAVLSLRLCDWKFAGFYVLPSLIFLAYIWGTLPWVFGVWRPAAKNHDDRPAGGHGEQPR